MKQPEIEQEWKIRPRAKSSAISGIGSLHFENLREASQS